MLYQPMLLWIVHFIESSSLQTVPNFLTALLESHNPELETVVPAIKSPNGIRKILTLMAAYQSDGAVEMWALEMSQRIYVNEVKMVIHKVHGLHFNACSTTAEDITNFSLEKIIHKFCDVTPKTWTLMQTLLDVNGEAH